MPVASLPSQSLETLCIHGGQEPDRETGAVMTPIVLSTTFAQDHFKNLKLIRRHGLDIPSPCGNFIATL